MKTVPSKASVTKFLDRVTPAEKREDCFQLNEMMQRITGKPPVIWGDSIVGFGEYHYKYESGREGDFFRTGFAPRKSALTIYIMPGFKKFQPLMKKLGKHKTSVSCLYVKKLADLDLNVLEQLIRSSLQTMNELYPE